MGLIAISVLFLFYVLSFTLTFTRDHCMHFNKAMLSRGRPEQHIYSGVVQILPQVHTLLTASFCFALPEAFWCSVEHKNDWWQTRELGWLLIPNMLNWMHCLRAKVCKAFWVLKSNNDISERLSCFNAQTLQREMCLSADCSFKECDSQSSSCL